MGGGDPEDEECPGGRVPVEDTNESDHELDPQPRPGHLKSSVARHSAEDTPGSDHESYHESDHEPDQEPDPWSQSAIISPTTPQKQKGHDIPVLGDTAPEPRSVLNNIVASPTASQEQKSPDSPPISGTDLVSFLLSLGAFIKDQIVDLLTSKLTTIFRELVVRSALVMGCTHSYHTYFTPPTAEIRQELSSFADLNAKRIADMTADMMLAEWEKQCRDVIQKYQKEMRRDLLKDAKKEAEALKPKVIEAVEGKVKALEQHQFNNQLRPSTPIATDQARPTPTIDDINAGVGAFKIATPKRERKPSELTSPCRRFGSPLLHVMRTPKTPRTAPRRFGTPQSHRSKNSEPMTPRPNPLVESPVKAHVPAGHEHAGMLGPHQCFSPINRPKPAPPPQFKLNPED